MPSAVVRVIPSKLKVTGMGLLAELSNDFNPHVSIVTVAITLHTPANVPSMA